MNYLFVALVSYVLLIIVSATPYDPQRTQNGVVVVGGSFQLKCASANPVCGALQWTKRGLWTGEETISYGRSLMTSGSSSRRYAMNASGVPCDVMISDVKVEDAGEFTCVSPDSGRQSAQLTVLESAVNCGTDVNSTDEGEGEVLEGETVRVHCSLVGYHSPGEARLEWTDSHHQTVLSAAVTQRPGSVNSTFLLIARSPAIYPFTCRIEFNSHFNKLGAARNVPDITCTTTQIHVVYPVRDIRLDMNGTRLTPGKVVTCTADGAPRPTYRWVTMTTSEIRHGNSVVMATGHVYQCVATNVIRGRVYEVRSWEIYVRDDPANHPGTTEATSHFLSSSSSRLEPSTHLLLADQPRDLDLYEYDIISRDDDPVVQDDEVTEIYDVTPQKISRDNRLGIISIVLGILLLVSLIVMLVIIVHLCGLRDKLKEVERARNRTVNNGTPLIQNSAHCVTDLPAHLDVENNESAKSLMSDKYDSRQINTSGPVIVQ